jgi:hypothetical protein
VARGLFAALFGAGCPGGNPLADCPDEELYASEIDSCDETFCGEPDVWAATGSTIDSFRRLAVDDPLPIYWGTQGGYHFDAAVEMNNLCPIVFARFELYDESSGSPVLIHEQQNHVQACRTSEPCSQTRQEESADPPSHQRWWGVQFRFPCAYFPDPPIPNQAPFCADEHVADLETLDLLFRVEAEDHNGRIGWHELPIAPRFDRTEE